MWARGMLHQTRNGPVAFKISKPAKRMQRGFSIRFWVCPPLVFYHENCIFISAKKGVRSTLRTSSKPAGTPSSARASIADGVLQARHKSSITIFSGHVSSQTVSVLFLLSCDDRKHPDFAFHKGRMLQRKCAFSKDSRRKIGDGFVTSILQRSLIFPTPGKRLQRPGLTKKG